MPLIPEKNAPSAESGTEIDNEVDNAEEAPVSAIEQRYRNCRLSINEEFPEEDYLVEIDGIRFLPKGNISVLKATQKSGKTMCVSCLAAALIKGDLWRIKSVKDDSRILVVDTEQARRSTYKFYKRTLLMAGCRKEDIYDRFEVINLREDDIESRIEMIRYAICNKHPDFVVIDGIVDICQDFNSIQASNEVINLLMKMSSRYNCNILCVLHTNPSDGDGKARGHLGTIAAQKAAEVLQMKKDDDIFNVSCYCSREAPIPSWAFRFDENGILVCADEWVEEKRTQKKEADEQAKMQECVKIVEEYLMNMGGSANLADIKVELMKQLNLKKTAAYGRMKKIRPYFLCDGKTMKLKNVDIETGELFYDDILQEINESDPGEITSNT